MPQMSFHLMAGQIISLCLCPSISYCTGRKKSLIFHLRRNDASLKNENELRQKVVELFCYTTENTETLEDPARTLT